MEELKEKDEVKTKKRASKKERIKEEPETTAEDPRQAALNEAIAGIEKAFGKGAVMKFGDISSDNIPVITTGSLSLDVALGVGGLPKGRIVEVYGPESSGKTTIALHCVAETQKLGGIAGYIDAEHALDPVYAKKLGVNIDELYISQPDDGEQALEIAEHMVRSGAIDIVVIDSVAALVPRAEIEGSMGASHMGVQARLMSQALRKLTGITSKTNCIVIFINQLRDKIGVTFGNPETTTGGRALKFYASVRIDIRKIDSIKAGAEFVGNRTRVKVAKNKVAPPFKQCEFDIMYGHGISKEGDILDLGTLLGIVSKSGAWFGFNDIRLGQGRENAKDYLKDHPDVSHEIENAVRGYYGMKELEALTLPDNYIQPSDLTEENVDVTQDDLLIDEMLINLEDDE
ncbi:MAG: recombinase RecA [Clostridiales bacterium]|jgi:recombination protein RecA|nr:recombinase RecA [Clostridiales bacterium]